MDCVDFKVLTSKDATCKIRAVLVSVQILATHFRMGAIQFSMF